MPMSNATKNATLKAHLQGTDPAYRAGATQYLAYLSLATPDPAAPIASELTYTGYIRTPLTKATAWTDGGNSFTNAALVPGGKRTDAGAVQTIRSVAIVDTPSGPVSQCIFGATADSLDVGLNIKPTFDPGTITVTVTP